MNHLVRQDIKSFLGIIKILQRQRVRKAGPDANDIAQMLFWFPRDTESALNQRKHYRAMPLPDFFY